jgi:DNA-binding transcriptional ArsR family regulator
MPVEFDSYSPDDGRIDLTEGTNAGEIMSFLLEHPDVGFTPGEIHERTGVARGSINPTLARLESAGLVRHKGDYWAAAEDDRIAVASAAVLGVEATETAQEDWYSENTDWIEEAPDLSEGEGEQ